MGAGAGGGTLAEAGRGGGGGTLADAGKGGGGGTAEGRVNVGVPTTWVVATGAAGRAAGFTAAVVDLASTFDVERTALAIAFAAAGFAAAFAFVREALGAAFGAALVLALLLAVALVAPLVVCLAAATGFVAGFFARLAPPEGEVAFAFERLGVDVVLREECRAVCAMKVAGA